MEEHFCDVGQYRAGLDCKFCSGNWIPNCPQCRIGCFQPAKFRNPNYDPEGIVPGTIYNYAEWLCARHYDEVMDFNARKERGDLEPWEEGINAD